MGILVAVVVWCALISDCDHQSHNASAPTCTQHCGPEAPTVFPPLQTVPDPVDLLGDLMIWAPDVPPPTCPEDPVTHIRCVGDDGQVPAGLLNGWVWAPSIYRYPSEMRQRLYADVKAQGYHTLAIHVPCPSTPGWYHGLYPTDCANWNGIGVGPTLNAVVQELRAAGIDPLCAGVSPAQYPARGFEAQQCQLAMSDWDDVATITDQLNVLSAVFLNARLFFELPAGLVVPPRSDGDSTTGMDPTPTNGPAYLAALQRRFPQFAGVLYEFNQGDGLPYLQQLHGWWGSVPEYLFETDTFWKFWQNLNNDAEKARNRGLLQQAPWLRGCMSGC